MTLDKEQIKYIKRLIDSKERTAQPLERLFIEGLRKDLFELEKNVRL